MDTFHSYWDAVFMWICTNIPMQHSYYSSWKSQYLLSMLCIGVLRNVIWVVHTNTKFSEKVVCELIWTLQRKSTPQLFICSCWRHDVVGMLTLARHFYLQWFWKSLSRAWFLCQCWDVRPCRTGHRWVRVMGHGDVGSVSLYKMKNELTLSKCQVYLVDCRTNWGHWWNTWRKLDRYGREKALELPPWMKTFLLLPSECHSLIFAALKRITTVYIPWGMPLFSTFGSITWMLSSSR